jgi:hypothetical protein
MYRENFSDKFNWFTNMFVATISMALAIYAIYIAGGSKAMTQPLPPIVLGLTSPLVIRLLL